MTVVVAAGVFEEARWSFQKFEVLAGSALATSLPLSEEAAAANDKEAFEGERESQVAALLFGAGLSPSTAFEFSTWDFSVAGLSLTVALRVATGLFLSFGFISAGSSETSCLSRPIIHHDPEDLTLTASVFLSSISPIKKEKKNSIRKLPRSRRAKPSPPMVDHVHPMFLIAILNLFQSHR